MWSIAARLWHAPQLIPATKWQACRSTKQRLLEAIGDTMGMLAAEQRKEREQEFDAMRQKIATLEGRVDVLMSLIQGKGQIIDLPPLPARKRHVA
jgi:hypothetical protein